jgi:hypothetical protein
MQCSHGINCQPLVTSATIVVWLHLAAAESLYVSWHVIHMPWLGQHTNEDWPQGWAKWLSPRAPAEERWQTEVTVTQGASWRAVTNRSYCHPGRQLKSVDKPNWLSPRAPAEERWQNEVTVTQGASWRAVTNRGDCHPGRQLKSGDKPKWLSPRAPAEVRWQTVFSISPTIIIILHFSTN